VKLQPLATSLLPTSKSAHTTRNEKEGERRESSRGTTEEERSIFKKKKKTAPPPPQNLENQNVDLNELVIDDRSFQEVDLKAKVSKEWRKVISSFSFLLLLLSFTPTIPSLDHLVSPLVFTKELDKFEEIMKKNGGRKSDLQFYNNLLETLANAGQYGKNDRRLPSLQKGVLIKFLQKRRLKSGGD
jgi:hypothetical protein